MHPRIHKWMLCLFLMGLPNFAQTVSPPPPLIAPRRGIAQPDDDEGHTRIVRDMAKRANKERVAALKTDTDKLLKLSVELKTYVDKSDENVLSLEVIKKAEEIEKLAHSVKDKMKGPN